MGKEGVRRYYKKFKPNSYSIENFVLKKIVTTGFSRIIGLKVSAVRCAKAKIMGEFQYEDSTSTKTAENRFP